MRKRFVFVDFNKRQKNIIVIFFLFVITILFLSNVSIDVFADELSSDSIHNEITSIVEDIVYGLDVSDLENLISNVDDFDLFDGGVKDKIIQILKGEYFTNYSSLIKGIISLIVVDIKNLCPLIFTILGIGLMSVLITNFKYSGDDSVSEIINFISFGIMMVLLMLVFKDVLNKTSTTMALVCRQMDIVFPILIALLATIGSFSSISIYNPLVAVLTSGVSFLFEKFLFSIFIAIFVLGIVDNLTDSINFTKMQGFLGSCFKWSIGIIFTLFSGFLSIQGITAGKYDGVSIKATKFAVKSYIPIIGSYIADGIDFLVLGSILVKNTIGLVGFLILFLSIISPILSILVVKLSLQLCSAILEMSGGCKMSRFLSSCSKSFVYPIILILGVSFMYIITLSLIMCTANVF